MGSNKCAGMSLLLVHRLTWLSLNKDFSKYFDNITRMFQYLETKLACGSNHAADEPLLDELERAYPHRPAGCLGVVCPACPEPGVNMPLATNIPTYLRFVVCSETFRSVVL